jgi:ERCC4-type nuclease
MASEQTLPGLRGLAKLSELRPIIAIDSREKEPLKFTRLQAVERALFTGDYSIMGLEEEFAVERKSLDDLVNCCLSSNRDRFEHELHRLRGYFFKRLLIIGSREDIAAGLYHLRIAPKAVLATLAAFEVRYSIPVIFCSSPEEAAEMIERWVWYFSREVVKNANDLLRGCTAPSTAPQVCASASPGAVDVTRRQSNGALSAWHRSV